MVKQRICDAPKDGTIVMVDGSKFSPWIAGHWIDDKDWGGWVYQNDQLNELDPMGLNPSYWFPLPK